MAIGATSHQIGGAITMVLCGYLVDKYGWEMNLFIPGFVCILIAIFYLID